MHATSIIILAVLVTVILGVMLALKKIAASYPDGTLAVSDEGAATAQILRDLDNYRTP